MKNNHRELALMIDAMCAAIKCGVKIEKNSPCHKKARQLLRESGFKFKHGPPKNIS